jgi:glyoxylase-like metal-dependent hydrolase (beta-lactamase superfamily II)
LNIYYIDTEGGSRHSSLTPSGSRCWFDTVTPANVISPRIVDALKTAGVKQIDHMWTTHYHGDHVGALLALENSFR